MENKKPTLQEATDHVINTAQKVQTHLAALCGGGGLVTELFEALYKYREAKGEHQT